MDGTTLRAGAVACVKTMKNPILAARRVCDDTPHVLLCGPGAEAFARECGIPEYRNELLVTPRQRARWQELHALAQKQGADVVRAGAIGTIGAVAVDKKGHVAACTSTGGTPYKRPGRVGDTPIIGAGTYADDHEAAASSTGLGQRHQRATRRSNCVTRSCISFAEPARTRRPWPGRTHRKRYPSSFSSERTCSSHEYQQTPRLMPSDPSSSAQR